VGELTHGVDTEQSPIRRERPDRDRLSAALPRGASRQGRRAEYQQADHEADRPKAGETCAAQERAGPEVAERAADEGAIGAGDEIGLAACGLQALGNPDRQCEKEEHGRGGRQEDQRDERQARQTEPERAPGAGAVAQDPAERRAECPRDQAGGGERRDGGRSPRELLLQVDGQQRTRRAAHHAGGGQDGQQDRDVSYGRLQRVTPTRDTHRAPCGARVGASPVRPSPSMRI